MAERIGALLPGLFVSEVGLVMFITVISVKACLDRLFFDD
jgi:hypothetical protein